MVIKLIALGTIGYLNDKMNIFDGSIVILSIIELVMMEDSEGDSSTSRSVLSVFRSVRVLKIFKSVKTFKIFRMTKIFRTLDYLQVIVDVISRTFLLL